MSDQPTVSAPVWDGDKAPLAKAFIVAQQAMDTVGKASVNPFFSTADKVSRYADLADVVRAVVPALNGAGVGVMQFPAFDGALVSVTTVLVHDSGSSVTSTLHLRPSKTDPQGVGSAITYGRRYGLLAVTGVAPEDDDGNAASGPVAREEAKRVEPSPPTLAQRADKLEATLKAVKTAADLDKAYKLASGLMAELDQKDPERFEGVKALHAKRDLELAPKAEPVAA